MKNKINYYFYLLTGSILVVAFINSFFQPDRKGDGLLYDYIGRNLYLGVGSLWSPHLSNTLWPVFTEHPPLGFFFTSLPYYFFGDNPYNGEVFFIFTFFVLMVPLYGLWKKAFQNHPTYHVHFWLVPVSFAAMPLVQNIYQKGFLEAIFAPITAAAIYTFINAFQNLKENNKFYFYLYFISANLLIIMAFMVKGPTTIFPLATPFLYFWLIENKNIKKGIFFSLTSMIFFASLTAVLIILIPSINQIFNAYLNTRSGDLGHFTYTFKTVFNAIKTFFILEPLRPLGVVAVFTIWFNLLKIEKLKLNSDQKKWSWFFYVTALTAFLPLFVSPKFYTYYIVTSLPYVTMAIIMIMMPRWDYLINHAFPKTKMALRVICVLVVVYSVIFSIQAYNKKQPSSDFDDVKKIGEYFSENNIVKNSLLLCPNLRDPSGRNIRYGDPWFWHIYFNQFLNLELIFEDNNDDFMLGVQSDEECGKQLPSYKEIDLELSKYQLFKKVNHE